MSHSQKPKLIICDLDNTLFDWIDYFAPASKASILKASEVTGIPYEKLCEEYKEILDREESIEYPFVIQQLPSILQHYHFDFEKMLAECCEPARNEFTLTAYPWLKPYPNVIKTLKALKETRPDAKLTVLTDAPLQVAIWRLYKLGILNYFDGIYGLENPKLPLIQNNILVSKEVLFKNIDRWRYGFLGRLRELPNDYGKPNPGGFKNMLMDFNFEKYNKRDIVFIGDNVYKDVQLCIDQKITSIWAKFGVNIEIENLDVLREFVPERFIHKGIKLSGDFPKADHVIEDFSEILTLL